MAVLEAILPRVERKLDEHAETTRYQSQIAEASRKEIRDSIQEVKDAIKARENQAKGAIYIWEFIRGAAVFVAGVLGLKWFGFMK